MADPKSGGQRTHTAPEHARAPHLGIDPVVAMWAPALAAEIELPDALAFTFGCAADRDVVIRHPSISRQHARAERRGDVLAVFDEGSKNGMGYNGRACAEAMATANGVLKLGEVTALLLTRSMREARRRLAFWLGYGATVASDAVAAAGRDQSFLIIGESERARLEVARALHLASPRRERPTLTISTPLAETEIHPQLSAVAGGAVFVDAYPIEEMPARARAELAKQLASPTWSLAVFWLSRSRDVATARYGAAQVARMQTIDVPSVAIRARGEELPAMLDTLFAIRGETCRTSMLPVGDLRALASYAWPNDHDELEQCASYIAGRARGLSQRAIARETGWDRGDMRRTVARWGLTL